MAVTPSSPLPEAAAYLRAGTWMRGINWPWDHYGTDFGSNAWGYRGLRNQGPSGWRVETRGADGAAHRLFWAQRGPASHCLGVEVKLQGPLSSGLVLYRVDEPAEKAVDATVNLAGQTVSVEVYLPSGAQGPINAPSSAMVFFQDNDWTWAQTAWANITVVDDWVVLEARPDMLPFAGFDPTRIRTVGVKLGTNSGATGYTYTGAFYVDNVTASTAPEIAFQFDAPETRTEREMKDAAGLGIHYLRWWLFADGRAGLVFDSNGFVVGLEDRFLADLDELIRLCRSARTYLVLTLFDFLWGAQAQTLDGVQLFGRADLLTDPDKRRSLLDNGVAKVFDRLASANEVAILDLFNEPEWLLSDVMIPPGKRPPEIAPGGVIDLATMKAFFAELVQLHRDTGLQQKQLLTVGSASPRWAGLWVDLGTDLRLDMVQFHLWNGPGQIDEGLPLDFPPPVTGVPNFLGEFSTLPGGLQSPCRMLPEAQDLGYVGAFPWAHRAKDVASLPLLGESTRDCLARSTFHTVTPCRVLDTRTCNGLDACPLAANSERAFSVAGPCGIPPTARAISVNVTVVQPTAAGHFRVYPGLSSLPLVSTLNYGAGQTRANNAIVSLGALGDFQVRCVQLSGSAHLVVDVNGYFR